MRGHTSDRLLKACLKSLISREKALITRFGDDDYTLGKVHALEEVAVLLYIDLEEK